MLAPGSNEFFDGLANATYDNIVEKGFDRGDENDADKHGVRLASSGRLRPGGARARS